MVYDIGNLRISLPRCHVSLCLNLLSGKETPSLDLQRQDAQRALKQVVISSPEKDQHAQMRLWFSETKEVWPALILLSEPHNFQHFHGAWPYHVPLEVIPVCVGLDTAQKSQGGWWEICAEWHGLHAAEDDIELLVILASSFKRAMCSTSGATLPVPKGWLLSLSFLTVAFFIIICFPLLKKMPPPKGMDSGQRGLRNWQTLPGLNRSEASMGGRSCAEDRTVNTNLECTDLWLWPEDDKCLVWLQEGTSGC